MFRTVLKAAAIAAIAAAAFAFNTTFTSPAQAQYRGMSCSELWYARNRIYARNGYCFRSQRAIRVFGRGCFPPFGRLRGYDKREVDEIQYAEARRGC